MTKWTYARRFEARRDREALTVPFEAVGWSGAVGCLIPGCHWTHPTRDEAAMTEHARREWEGRVQYPPQSPFGYTGAHVAGKDCPCGPIAAVRWIGTGDQMTAVLVHNGPEEEMYGPAAQRVIEQSQRAMSGEAGIGG